MSMPASLSRPFRLVSAVALGVLVGLAPSLAGAQPAARQLPRELRQVDVLRQAVPDQDPQRAEHVRQQLRQVMDQYPPALGRILRLDPTLMTNAAYLAPYPGLVAFLQQHPEVPKDADYYLEFARIQSDWEPTDPALRARERAIGLWRDVLTGLMVFSVFMTVVLTLTWMIRYFVGHRRWLRAVQVHSDLHGRVMERLGSSEELLGYLQSPAGRQVLQPPAGDAATPQNVAAPFGRILWSIQTALVLACGGVGLLVIKRYVIDEVAQMMLVLGVLAVSLGIGFGLAAAASYMLSQRLGLLDSPHDGSRQGA